MAEQKGPVCLYNTTQAQEENSKWVWLGIIQFILSEISPFL